MTGPALPDYLAPHAEDLVALQRAVAHNRWLAATGRDAYATTDTAERYPHLSNGSLVSLALDHGDLSLAHELSLWYFRTMLARPTQELRQGQREVTVEVNGRSLSHAELLAARRTAQSTAEHDALGRAVTEASSKLDQYRMRWLEQHAQAVHRLGFVSHAHLVRALHPDADRWVTDAESWLERTREDFLTRWRRWQDQDSLAAPRLLDTRIVAEGAGTIDDPLGVVTATVKAWGLSAALDRITVDSEARAGKLSFSFCSPVNPPHDVRVSVTPGRSLRDLPPLLHEFGHALHFTSGVEHAWELWRIPTALTEAVGFAVEHVVHQPQWQQQHLGASLAPEAADRLRFGREAVRRLIATSLCYEMAVHDGHPAPRDLYEQMFGREFGISVSGADAFNRLQAYLEGQPCYPLVYYEAYRLRDPLWQYLEQQGGPQWWASPSAHTTLVDLFAAIGRTAPAEWSSSALAPAMSDM
ncbi:hypothetical protein HUT19_15560 [Streptomyces sp. NA02950]|uniref:hypothetical protein n=1 Tax=Streptomyces sp. NA02950 TaxID=2742137 RepID=UPI001591DE5C|nr:hypothetical protein [Streptomyces sp. NA02950]QKV92998.1 hypothetical protein HUT19_15560 [Streptomyces sp. NA02950]